MQIGHFSTDERVLIVAEVGNNHEGKFEVAKELVRRAAECGVDAVKFQTFQTKYFVSARDRARYERLSSFELSYSEFEQLQQLAKSLGLLFLSTPLDLDSAKFLEPLVDGYKIASGDNNFYPLIEFVCGTGRPIVVSSGLSDLKQIARSKQFIENHWKLHSIEQDVAVLHCVSSYPVPPEQANLAAIPFLARELGCTVGYSDHTIGVEASLIAAALGARIIEKHLTLRKDFSEFRDHQLSADPTEMQHLVQQVEQVQLLLGEPQKAIQESEAQSEHVIRRSIVAAADLSKGHQVRWQDLTWVRPAVGLAPGEEQQVVGKTLKRALSFGDPILPSDLE